MQIFRNLHGKEREWYINDTIRYYLNSNLPECNKPILLKDGRLVPCGHCEMCSGKLKKEWILRSRLELATSGRGMFLTLTFDNEHLEDTSYKVVQKFIKRLREYVQRKENKKLFIKYFGVYEEGETTYRPHYHMLVFGCDVRNVLHNLQKLPGFKRTENELLQTIWGQGFVYTEEMTPANISYVCGYVQKKQFVENCRPYGLDDSISNSEWRKINKYASNLQEADFLFNFPRDKSLIRRRVFYFMSKGLGFTWLYSNIQKVLKKKYISSDGFKYAVPRAFRKKIQELYNIDLFERESGEIVNNEFYKYCIENVQDDILSMSIDALYENVLLGYINYHFIRVNQKHLDLNKRRLLYEQKEKKKTRL